MGYHQELDKAKQEQERGEGPRGEVKRWGHVGSMQEAKAMMKVLFGLLCDAKEQVRGWG